MDVIQDWGDFVAAQIENTSNLKTAYTYLICARNYALAFLNVITRSESQPTIPTIALLIVIAFVSLKIFSFIVSYVLSWVYFAVKLAFFVSLGFFGVYVYQRGPEGVLQDVDALVATWSGEYEKQKRKVEFTKAWYDRAGVRGPARANRPWWS